jgi:hypothetical protein
MNQYIFRGKRLDNGEWVYGDHVGGYIVNYIDLATSWEPNTCDHKLTVRAFAVAPQTVGQSTGLPDGTFNFDIVEVCIFLVSPANPDNDKHFRGVVFYQDGVVQFKIYKYLKFDGKKSEWVALKARYLPFEDCELDEDGTFTISYVDFCGISGNLGEFNADNIEIVGNRWDNPELLQKE